MLQNDIRTIVTILFDYDNVTDHWNLFWIIMLSMIIAIFFDNDIHFRSLNVNDEIRILLNGSLRLGWEVAAEGRRNTFQITSS